VRLISYRQNEESGVGVMVDDEGFIPLANARPDLPRTLRGLLELGPDGLKAAKLAVAGKDSDHRINDVVLDPLIPEPPAIWCVGLNYVSHREETESPVTKQPTMFLRIAASQVGHLQPMVRPKASNEFDYEGELAVIIGTGGRHITEFDALKHIAGYACYNDGTLRDWQRHTSQFSPGKNFVATGGFGPWLVTADEFGDPYSQTMTTRLNGEVMQNASIDLMLFRIEKLIAYISTMYPLNPGDVISTGTAGGVGFRRDPPVFLKAGDTVSVEITGIGTLINPIIDEA
jgi:2-keto-4-pentenoate hydratase/2-oxohepta-3-ene-1,7-dioic acid hydratase in catechol pathway